MALSILRPEISKRENPFSPMMFRLFALEEVPLKGGLGKIAALIERTRATQLAAHIANIKDAEHGRNGHRPDWRASAHLLAIKAPDRFSTNQAQTVTINQSATVLAIGGPEQLKRMLQLYHRPADVQVADSKTLELTSPGEYSGKD